jgi:uncharacterized protein (UPF0335 family)
MDISKILVRGADGLVDLDATVLAFRGTLEVYIAERETENALIAQAVHEVFDQYKGASINMPALLHYVLQKMDATPANFGVLGERVSEYVRENAVTETNASGIFKNVKGIFKIAKGKGGGCKRVCDIAPEAPKA